MSHRTGTMTDVNTAITGTVPDSAEQLGRELWAHTALYASIAMSANRVKDMMVSTDGTVDLSAMASLSLDAARAMASFTPDPELGWRGSAPLLAMHGKVWLGSHLPARYTRGMAKACYQNTWAKVARSKTLIYCEGYGVSADLGVPMMHAWAYDPDTRSVIETTWKTDPEHPFLHAYLGLAIPTDIVREARARSRRQDIISVMDGDYARSGWFHREAWREAVALTSELDQAD